TTETYTPSLHDALPIYFADEDRMVAAVIRLLQRAVKAAQRAINMRQIVLRHLDLHAFEFVLQRRSEMVRQKLLFGGEDVHGKDRSEEHTSELQSRENLV